MALPAPPELIIWPATWLASLTQEWAPKLHDNIQGGIARSAGESIVARGKGWLIGLAGWLLIGLLPLLALVWLAAPYIARVGR